METDGGDVGETRMSAGSWVPLYFMSDNGKKKSRHLLIENFLRNEIEAAPEN